MFLVSPFAFPLGGEGLSSGLPWIVNLVPTPGQENVKLLSPVRFSIRDSETYIDPATIRVKAGYAKVFSDAEDVFDKLPNTKRVSLDAGLAGEPSILVVGEGIQITKTSSDPQRSVYATSIDPGLGYSSVMVTAVVRPDVLTPFDSSEDSTPLSGSVFPGPLMPLPYSPVESISDISDNGTVFGIEHGPRNKVIYIRFQLHTDGTKLIRFTSYVFEDGSSPVVNSSVVFDWSELRRYTIIWNEVEGYVEVYGETDVRTIRLFRVVQDNIPTMPEGYFARAGSVGNITAIYGQVGPIGDQSTWANIAVTSDVGFPVLGNIRPGYFVTEVIGSELLTVEGNRDPRDLDIGAWFTAPSSIVADPDSSAASSIDNGKFEMTKPTSGKSFAIYRDEPCLLSSNTDGFMIQARISAQTNTLLSASTGMGILVYDGFSVFQLQLFDDLGVRTIGLLKKNGSTTDITQHLLPSSPIDWTGEHLFRFVVDARRNTIRIYDGDNLDSPLFSAPFNRDDYPDSVDFDYVGTTPFIAFGHIAPTSTTGTFVLKKLEICHLYQSWVANDGSTPDDVATNPVFTKTASGGSSSAMADDKFVITSPTGGLHKLYRSAPFGVNRGAIIEAKLKIQSWRPRSRTGTYVLLDDGVHAYAITFVENNLGKFVAIPRRNGSGGFQELVGRDGDAAKLSFLLDWTEEHYYRLERRPFDGLALFLDDETEPRLTYPEDQFALLPDSQFIGSPTIAFGQFSTEAATSSWSYVRGLFSRGYEISFKKNKPDNVLRDELFQTQAIVVAHAADTD